MSKYNHTTTLPTHPSHHSSQQTPHSPPQQSRRRHGSGWLQPTQNTVPTLNILQLNVNRSSNNLQAVMNLKPSPENSLGSPIDIFMIQEPPLLLHLPDSSTNPRTISSSHIAHFPPAVESGRGPRVVTLVPKPPSGLEFVSRPDLLTQSFQTDLHTRPGDLVIVDVIHGSTTLLRIINVYHCNTKGDSRENLAIKQLVSLSFDSMIPTLIGGDFNSHHSLWQGRFDRTPSDTANMLADFISHKNFTLGFDAGTITYRKHFQDATSLPQESAIDLVLYNETLVATSDLLVSEVEPLGVTSASDHLPILTTLSLPTRSGPSDLAFPIKRTDWEKFEESLQSAISSTVQLASDLDSIPSHDHTSTRDALDVVTKKLEEAILSALQDSTPPPKLTTRSGSSWWNEECHKAHQKFCQARTAAGRRRHLLIATGTHTDQYQEELVEKMKTAFRTFRKTAKAAKITMIDEKIARLTDVSVFKALNWTKGIRPQTSPVMMRPGEPDVKFVTAEEKSSLLFTTLLPTPLPVDPASLPPIDMPPYSDNPLLLEEARDAIFRPKQDKSAGPDLAPYRALRILWNSHQEVIFNILKHCLRVGFHPRCFKRATLVVLRKPGKRDPTAPRSYRLISLLPCLGKALERIVAARLTYLAQRHHWVPPIQFGGLPHRCTADAILTLAHDIQSGWNLVEQRVTSLLAFDVQGAFDSVHPTRLIHRLRLLGVPAQLVDWTRSFLQDRKARILLDGQLGKEETVSSGIPQGSPVAPILFLLFSGSLFSLLTDLGVSNESDLLESRPRTIAYIDDGAIYLSTKVNRAQPHEAADNNIVQLKKAFDLILKWGQDNGIAFDPKKRELIHFPPSGNIEVASYHPDLVLEDGVVKATSTTDSVRLLGFHLDTKLAFKRHVSIIANKARQTVGALHLFANTLKGMNASRMRLAYLASARAVLLYGFQVYWGGLTQYERRQNAQSDTLMAVPSATDKALTLSSVQNRALRQIIPVWRTTPIYALEKEAAIPPINLALDHARRMASIRLRRLPLSHPLLQRLGVASSDTAHSSSIPPIDFSRGNESTRARHGRHFQTVLTRLNLLASKGERIKPSARPPWKAPLSQHPQVTVYKAFESKKKAAASAKTLISQLQRSGENLLLFSDGSMTATDSQPGSVGAGWVAFYQDTCVSKGKRGLGTKAEVFDGEAQALLESFKYAHKFSTDTSNFPLPQNFHFFVDNLAVVSLALTQPMCSSQKAFAEIETIARKLINISADTHLHLHWIPSHTGIRENEIVDQLAKDASKMKPVAGIFSASRSPQTFAYTKRVEKAKLQVEWQDEWDDPSKRCQRSSPSASSDPPSQYRTIVTPEVSLSPPETLEWPRKYLGYLVQARTGHGDFAPYHQRFGHENYRTYCPGESCRGLEIPYTYSHPLVCPTFTLASETHLLREDGGFLETNEILQDTAGARAFLAFVKDSTAYERLPPPTPTISPTRSPSLSASQEIQDLTQQLRQNSLSLSS